MKNFDSLERDLQPLSGNDAPAPSRQELVELASLLRSASASKRSSQHQEWAWTRCAALMNEKPEPSFFSLFQRNLPWLGSGAALALVCLLSVQFVFDDPGPLPKVTANSANISAVPFHSTKANADVIWVSGYNYLPASHTIR